MAGDEWSHAIAHVDADCFYVSCELVRRPELRGKPLCVLSSQDACVVAKTYDAKAAGIKTGMTLWEARRCLPEATFLSADFRYYGKLSDQLFAILRRYSPEVEEYSIDEAFLNLGGLSVLRGKPYRHFADALRAVVRQEIGITVSVGISVTRTLAKMASEYNKPDGTTVVAKRRAGDFLQRVGVRDIPGVGANRMALLHKYAIRTAADFANADEGLIRRLLGKGGVELWYELRGTPVYGVSHVPRTPKSVARTASMGTLTGDPGLIRSHLVRHTMRLSRELIGKRLTARRLTVFLTDQMFRRVPWSAELPYATADYFQLIDFVEAALAALYSGRELYRACGVVADGIAPRQESGFDLFQQAEAQREARDVRLLETVHAINRKYGENVVSICAGLKWANRHSAAHATRFAYPMLECQ